MKESQTYPSGNMYSRLKSKDNNILNIMPEINLSEVFTYEEIEKILKSKDLFQSFVKFNSGSNESAIKEYDNQLAKDFDLFESYRQSQEVNSIKFSNNEKVNLTQNASNKKNTNSSGIHFLDAGKSLFQKC